jgi:hypothetical protein
VPRGTHEPGRSPRAFAYWTITVCGGPFQRPSASVRIGNSVERERPLPPSRTTPVPQRPSLEHDTGLGSSPFAHHYSGNGLSSSGYLDVSVPRLTPTAPMCSARGDTGSPCRVSPFGDPRIKRLLTAPRGLSQPTTSFIGLQCQGIPRAPLVASLCVLPLEIPRLLFSC